MPGARPLSKVNLISSPIVTNQNNPTQSSNNEEPSGNSDNAPIIDNPNVLIGLTKVSYFLMSLINQCKFIYVYYIRDIGNKEILTFIKHFRTELKFQLKDDRQLDERGKKLPENL